MFTKSLKYLSSSIWNISGWIINSMRTTIKRNNKNDDDVLEVTVDGEEYTDSKKEIDDESIIVITPNKSNSEEIVNFLVRFKEKVNATQITGLINLDFDLSHQHSIPKGCVVKINNHGKTCALTQMCISLQKACRPSITVVKFLPKIRKIRDSELDMINISLERFFVKESYKSPGLDLVFNIEAGNCSISKKDNYRWEAELGNGGSIGLYIMSTNPLLLLSSNLDEDSQYAIILTTYLDKIQDQFLSLYDKTSFMDQSKNLVFSSSSHDSFLDYDTFIEHTEILLLRNAQRLLYRFLDIMNSSTLTKNINEPHEDGNSIFPLEDTNQKEQDVDAVSDDENEFNEPLWLIKKEHIDIIQYNNFVLKTPNSFTYHINSIPVTTEMQNVLIYCSSRLGFISFKLSLGVKFHSLSAGIPNSLYSSLFQNTESNTTKEDQYIVQKEVTPNHFQSIIDYLKNELGVPDPNFQINHFIPVCCKRY